MVLYLFVFKEITIWILILIHFVQCSGILASVMSWLFFARVSNSLRMTRFKRYDIIYSLLTRKNRPYFALSGSIFQQNRSVEHILQIFPNRKGNLNHQLKELAITMKCDPHYCCYVSLGNHRQNINFRFLFRVLNSVTNNFPRCSSGHFTLMITPHA